MIANIKNIGTCLSFSLLCLNAYAQQITLTGKQFKLDGNNFYPKILNYSIEPVYDAASNTYFMSTNHTYGLNNQFECSGHLDCKAAIQADLHYIKNELHFNAIRVNGMFPKYINNILVFPFKNFNQDGYTNIVLNPTHNILNQTAYNTIVLPLFSDLLEIATAESLKVIIMIAGEKSVYGLQERGAYNDYAYQLSGWIASDPNQDALFAYDLFNEPCYNIDPIGLKTKEEACNMVNTWITTIRGRDNEHLITIGSCGISDVLSFDPTILNVDFLSLHSYPEWAPWENKSQTGIQQRGWNRIINNMIWFNNNSSVPWIIGETSLSAEDSHPFGIIPDATEAEQAAYASYTMNASCNCGGSGYSWWNYQDNNDDIRNNSHNGFQGIVYSGNRTPPYPYPRAKPIKNSLNAIPTNMTIASCGPCPLTYNGVYNINSIYYNPFKRPLNTQQTITGTIKDQDGNPIKDAYIAGRTYLGKDIRGNSYNDYHFTVSAEDGSFQFIPYQYLINTTGGGFIEAIDISAAGSERRAFGSPNHYQFDSMPLANSNYQLVLKGEKFNYDGSITNINIPSPVIRNFKSKNSLTATDITVQPGAKADFFAKKKVHLHSGFHAAYGSKVHIYCATALSDCNDFSSPNYLMQYRLSNNSPSTNQSTSNLIELIFGKVNIINQLTVSPNPSSGPIKIQLNNNDSAKNTFIEVSNILGEGLLSKHFTEASISIDLTPFNKGIYLIKLTTGTNNYFQKVIIQ
jgi:hypothetical protein